MECAIEVQLPEVGYLKLVIRLSSNVGGDLVIQERVALYDIALVAPLKGGRGRHRLCDERNRP